MPSPPPPAGGSGGSATPSPPPGPTPSYQQAQVVLSELPSTALQEELVSTLTRPALVGPPDLIHFVPSRSAVTFGLLDGVTSAPGLLAGILVAAVAAVAACLAFFRSKPWLSALRRVWAEHPLRAGTSAGAAALIVAGVIVAVAQPWRAQAPPALPYTSVVAAPGGSGATRPVLVSSDANLHASSASGPQLWDRLAAIETAIAADQRLLASQEGTIRSDTVAIGNGSAPGRLAQLESALGSHHAASVRYTHDLAAEYDFYRNVAGDPGAREQLLVEAQDQPAALSAIRYDLNVVQTILAQEAAISEAAATTVPPAAAGAPFFMWPIRGPITQFFGPSQFSLEPPLIYGGVFYPHFHTGIDIAGPDGAPVRAAAAGVVILAGSSLNSAGELVGYGNYVVIENADGYETLYAHLSGFAVRSGDTVTQGQVVGFEGATGWATGPHVHFEIRRGGQFLNPLPLLPPPTS